VPYVSSINPAAVRSYDLRGVVGRELGSEDARALGLAYAAVAREQNRHVIAVGRDGRCTSLQLERALIEGLIGGGMRVRRIGLGPTPQLYFAVHAFGLEGGIMVTGSHNPADENGFKLLLGNEPVYGAALRALVATQGRLAPGGRNQDLAVTSAYIEHLGCLGAQSAPFKVVWDCGNGAVGALIEPLTSRLPGQHILLNAEVDGTFPAHHPDPSVAANLRQLQSAVVAQRADLGIAFDGDGDRIGLVDESGVILWPDQLLLLLAEDVLASQPGAAIVADVKSSRVLFDGIKRLNGRAVMAPSGYVLVRAAMVRERAPLAGEMSGHIMFAEAWNGSDDALFVALRTLGALSRRRCSLGEFRRSLPKTAATPELRLPCLHAPPADVVREVASRLAASSFAVDTTDGLRVTTDNGWWLLRASGTESKLTARCEAADRAGLQCLCRELVSQLRQSGLDGTHLAPIPQ
jgi:phosphomannomutase